MNINNSGEFVSQLIVVIGAYGVGKSTMCGNFSNSFIVISSDREKENTVSAVEEALDKGDVLLDLSFNVAKTIKDLYPLSPLVLAILESEDVHKERIKERGGEWSVGVVNRRSRIERIADDRANHKGTLTEVSNFIEYEILKTKTNFLPHKDSLIYKATTPNGKVYIGQTTTPIKGRMRRHLYDAIVRQHPYMFSNAIRKYRENITWEVKELCKKENLDEREIHWIAHYDSNNPQKGYNSTKGGLGWNGREHSQETKDNISKANKGRPSINKGRPGTPWSQEQKNWISKLNTGRQVPEGHMERLALHNANREWFTEEVRQKMSESLTGKRHSEETKKLISEVTSGENNGMYGRTHDEKALAKMKGRKASAETKALSSKVKSKTLVVDDKGNTYLNDRAAALALNIGRTAVKGKIERGELKRIPNPDYKGK